ncbi:MAG: ATP-dependent DNA ligase [Thermoanaerobaculia bacterium]|nr:ATP-dependent DNA ligase [Thermoanaerobaculia bacterium]
MFAQFASTADAIGATSGKIEKEEILASHLEGLDDPALERAVLFFTGKVFALRDERVTGVGWSSIVDAAAEVASVDRSELARRARELGDLGDALDEAFESSTPETELTVLQVADAFDNLAETRGKKAKTTALAELLSQATAPEAKYIAKILVGELRIGLREGLVEGAIRRAFDQKLRDVRRAMMLTNDLGSVALLAKADALDTAKIELFSPIGLMLAQPEEDPQAIIDHFGTAAIADDKYDGIRAQIHTDGKDVRIFSRTMDSIGDRFPELVEAARRTGARVILDGEIAAFDGHVLPFARLQNRLGRKRLTDEILRESPVRYFAFDLLYMDGTRIDEPLSARLREMREVIAHAGPEISPGNQIRVETADDIERAFAEARARANEGLVVKDPQSLYTPGRRGKAWLKYKKALATLDCVVTAAERGHGKRRNLLSDVTFAVRRDDELVNIGKAYSGLTDKEIETTTELFRERTIERHGPVHVVEPFLVLEIAFDRIQESKRHRSGYALRFPRIVRIREDKDPTDCSTIDDVRRIYEGQTAREAPKESS